MRVFKYEENDQYGIDGLTDVQLILLYNVTVNYRTYLLQIIDLPDKALLVIAPGLDAKMVRANLHEQLQFCEDYITTWDNIIKSGNKPGKFTKLMN